MKKFLLAFGIILALAFSVTAATTEFNPTHETTVSANDLDCDKCDKKDCKGDCSTAKKECKKGDAKACCKKGDTAAAAKSCCKKGDSKKACTAKKGDSKKACASKEAH